MGVKWLKSRCHQDCTPFWSLQGRTSFFDFSSFFSHPYLLSIFLHLPNQQDFFFLTLLPWSDLPLSLFCLLLLLLRTLGYDPMDCIPSGFSVHGLLLAKILGWVAISSSRGSSRFRGQTSISCVSCSGRWILYPLSQREGRCSSLYGHYSA